MRFFVSAAALVALTPVVLAQTGPKINTVMSPTVCEPLQFTWEGGAPPYYLSLIPGGQPAAAAIRQFPPQNGMSMTWTVDLQPGTAFSSSLRDSTGAQAFSDIQTVQQGPDSSCLNSSSSITTSVTTLPASSSMAGTSAASTTATTAAVPPAAQKVISTTGSSSASVTVSGTVARAASSVASTTTATSTSTSSNAASLHNSASAIGIAGLLGLVGAALLG
ncbi:hypothetical protein C2E23DRAFT_317533 [Lenzites betulinus]|nr:hypothetical protein C2E23DRAFT_317533 [Lenzites betulinus]